ncbi:response regulator [Verrucomicrobia bacterium]|nr:response regulator [Verrucomicrobiota bacterium]
MFESPVTEVAQSIPDVEKTHPCLLVVDDDQSVRQSLNILFCGEMDVIEASTGAEALQILSSLQVDAVILDIWMPQLDGCETLERIKHLSPDTEVIMLTAHESLESAKKSLRNGACDYITKPFELSVIRKAVHRAIERRQNTDKIRSRIVLLDDYREEIEVERIQVRMADARSEVYASAIHDINGPLTVISGFASILSETLSDTTEVTGDNLNTTKRYIERIRKQVEVCIRVSHRYLGYYRGKRDKQVSANLNQGFEDVRELIYSHPSVSENQLSFVLMANETKLRINGADFIQILMNLCLNALQSSPNAHKVTVGACELPEPLDWNEFKDEPGFRRIICGTPPTSGSIVKVIVHDEGDGIPENILSRLFRRQFTTKGNKNGTGLGLAIIKRMLAEAGGAIEIRSTPGKGTTFAIFLALA